jgi:hypothetical protein
MLDFIKNRLNELNTFKRAALGQAQQHQDNANQVAAQVHQVNGAIGELESLISKIGVGVDVVADAALALSGNPAGIAAVIADVASIASEASEKLELPKENIGK